ncbi:cobyrinate a,c-diamide synthase [Streptomyces sp. SL13]|uniref:Hydrogenobyrinate a,c-diamide synthase n=1 Tax=Streptantibioticus silvisoli TaxID=2705255 RepID=A0AA90H4H7_9ACTN|nr:cobyrinate a,c-diamide synthase [Streptantibioticus silvisoli]MDI5970823.1 cobyrinate a,c-diamide synthase [Streptantibioticus silvisoli]
MVSPARLVVAAATSGAGKTMLATGLMAALRRTGLRVSGHKVGPDYIDPGYHALATGRPGRNLDPWLVGEDRVAPLLLHGATVPEPADIAVVEGVMGLHDGMVGRGDFASTAHVARLIAAPVLLVLDTAAQGRTAAAVVHGLRGFDPAVRVGGVVLNRVGSPRHESLLRDAMEEVGVPVLGVLPRTEGIVTPSRHLGLVPAAERHAEAEAVVAALADLVAEGVDLAAVLDLARTAPDLPVAAWDPGREVEAVGGGVRIAVAGGAAFSFGYAETTELLTAAGADVVTLDPLRDTALPDGTAGLVLGGGFPEEHAEQLSANAALRAEVAAFDGPVTAECGGLLYLCRSLDGLPMAGVLDAHAAMGPRLTLGYREAVAVAESPAAEPGERVTGHEFHRTVTDPPHGGTEAWRYTGTAGGSRHGWATPRLHAAYLHTHWAGRPGAARRFVEACRG